ncbi:hypothetical protein M378DRAFT_188664 [Amanita muscaria Koide BX008]|uniref:DNA 3'-5' helicase n=1 Tax=Amanita muscaria (strain Koide BX008) TaxID=946122 RepID=A0A0C2WHF7_AMAMK|nr:hypothetical protein M378DRAFT_188664 [Amanita muscaria Koide BX008]
MRGVNGVSVLESAHPTSTRNWTVNDVRELVWRKFGKRACWLQIQAALELYQGKDVVVCAATGFGKTLTFWIPLVMALEEGRDKVSVVVTPLNLLGKQNVEVLEKVGIPAVAVDGESASEEVFKDIEAGKYRVIIINPELLIGNAHVKKLWKFKFGSKILNFIFDEAHCISQWGDFRSEYKLVGELRYILNKKIPFYTVSATLPRTVLTDIRQILRLRSDTVYLQRSTDRPDIRLMARPLSFPANSFRDLEFLVPRLPEGYQPGDEFTVRKFVVFFDSVREAEDAAKHLMCLLPVHLQHKIAWFHSVMTPTFRKDVTGAFRDSDLWGLCATDAFGMGVDLPDIEIIVQWRATCSLCTLWQRFGRAARGSGYDAVAILLFEKKYLREIQRLL